MEERQRLSGRERQIVEAVYQLGEGTVAQVRERMPDPPGYDAVRTTMRLLTEKGVLRHRRDGQRYVYRPAVEKGKARQRALIDLVRTFFDGSAEAAALALLKLQGGDVTDSEIENLRTRLRRVEEGDGYIS
jgi:BlaI family transcriptional regulator, penicillinase repressor